MVDAKVKKMNIKLDLERPKYERKLAYEESICGEYRFAKRSQNLWIETLGVRTNWDTK